MGMGCDWRSIDYDVWGGSGDVGSMCGGCEYSMYVVGGCGIWYVWV